MIIVDENLNDQRLMGAIAVWFPGQVVSITSLRLRSKVLDEVIPTLLHNAVQPTFVTINVSDFLKKMQPHAGHCIVAVASSEKHAHKVVPTLLRRLLSLSDFKTKALRMGKIIHIIQNHIEYYERDRRIHSLQWPD